MLLPCPFPFTHALPRSHQHHHRQGSRGSRGRAAAVLSGSLRHRSTRALSAAPRRPLHPAVRRCGIEMGLWTSLAYLSQAFALITTGAGRVSFISTFTMIEVPLVAGLLGARIPPLVWAATASAVAGVLLLEANSEASTLPMHPVLPLCAIMHRSPLCHHAPFPSVPSCTVPLCAIMHRSPLCHHAPFPSVPSCTVPLCAIMHRSPLCHHAPFPSVPSCTVPLCAIMHRSPLCHHAPFPSVPSCTVPLCAIMHRSPLCHHAPFPSVPSCTVPLCAIMHRSPLCHHAPFPSVPSCTVPLCAIMHRSPLCHHAPFPSVPSCTVLLRMSFENSQNTIQSNAPHSSPLCHAMHRSAQVGDGLALLSAMAFGFQIIRSNQFAKQVPPTATLDLISMQVG
ncbi:unnamed protein product [Closterium sp. NIES-64]|nr:unnamed protein product [Closterium sp. NIES-64]